MIWSLQPFSQYYDLASHTNYVVCVNFIHKWRDLQFEVDSERQIFGNFICSHCFCQKSAARKSPKKYFHIFVSNSGFTSNKPTHYLLDYGDLTIILDWRITAKAIFILMPSWFLFRECLISWLGINCGIIMNLNERLSIKKCFQEGPTPRLAFLNSL